MQPSTLESAFIFDPEVSPLLDVMGPTIQFVTAPHPGAPCVMRGVIPPGAVIPIHSHPDPETFIQLSGEVEALVQSDDSFTWAKLAAGSVLHIPGNVRHAFRNTSALPSVGIITTTARLGEFFGEIGKAIQPGAAVEPPTEETLQHFFDAARRYGHWIGTPEDNAAIGMILAKT